MKILLTTSVALFAISTLIGTSAWAADMAVKAPPAPSDAPTYSRTGFYAGLNAGAAWGSSQNAWTVSPFFDAPAIPADATTTLRVSGFTGGGQAGYNYQVNNLVWGLEGDIGYTNLNVHRTTSTPPFLNQVDENYANDWLATFRGRLGVSPIDPLLLYATGGLSVAQIKLYDAQNFNATSNTSNSTRTGWTVGGGAEWPFAQNWTAKAEYLFVDLGTVTFNNLAAAGFIQPGTYSHRLNENIVRAGINYRFGM
jgi:outer membrane immunogenic protein